MLIVNILKINMDYKNYKQIKKHYDFARDWESGEWGQSAQRILLWLCGNCWAAIGEGEDGLFR